MDLVIDRTLELKATPQRVWNAITDPRELACWFPDSADVKTEEGYLGALTWEKHSSHEIQVVEVQPITRFAWRWAGGEERPLQEYSTLVEWTLVERPDGGTTLHVRESGFDSQKNFEDNSNGWDSELGELVKYLDES